jgi:glutamate synthase (NADPH/NADH) small chain
MTAPHAQPEGATHAWSTVARGGLPKRPATARVADFLEIYGLCDEAEARAQASRCIQCPEPLCVAGCPLHAHIPEWLALTAEGHFPEAAALLQSTSTLSEACTKVCPADHLCEATCIINGRAQPVSVWAVEQFLNDYAFSHDLVPRERPPPNGWRIAVIGAGPGGLACADELSRRGCAVTVFDWRPLPGGLLVYGTPAFRLERSVVQRRIDVLKNRGVEFRLGVKIGRDPSREQLLAGFDCVYLGFGARQPRTLAVPGATLPGVHQALPFIVQPNLDLPADTPPIDVAGRRVAVLGGGDTAIDCLRTAIRCGAREVTGIYRRDEASLPSSRREFENAVEEGVRFVFQSSPIAILGDHRGGVTGLRLIRTVPAGVGADERRQFTAQPGTEYDFPAERIFLALGFDPDPHPAANPFPELRASATGALVVDASQMTSTPGIFAGGDLVRGPSTALHAVRDARKAAAGIFEFLGQRRSGPDPSTRVGVPPSG